MVLANPTHVCETRAGIFGLSAPASLRFALEEKAKKAVTIESDCAPPGARVSASFVPYSSPVRFYLPASFVRFQWQSSICQLFSCRTQAR